jgi:hypothetical protein
VREGVKKEERKRVRGEGRREEGRRKRRDIKQEGVKERDSGGSGGAPVLGKNGDAIALDDAAGLQRGRRPVDPRRHLRVRRLHHAAGADAGSGSGGAGGGGGEGVDDGDVGAADVAHGVPQRVHVVQALPPRHGRADAADAAAEPPPPPRDQGIDSVDGRRFCCHKEMPRPARKRVWTGRLECRRRCLICA